jgi:hypothetical protein
MKIAIKDVKSIENVELTKVNLKNGAFFESPSAFRDVLADYCDAVDAEVEYMYLHTPRSESKVTLTDGSPVTDDHREIAPETGMQKAYMVLSDEERAKGLVRPLRHSYIHKTCGTVTTMSNPIAETYARDPSFYSGTYCTYCRKHFPVGKDGEFLWAGTTIEVGT